MGVVPLKNSYKLVRKVNEPNKNENFVKADIQIYSRHKGV
jgi:hypothetical protein